MEKQEHRSDFPAAQNKLPKIRLLQTKNNHAYGKNNLADLHDTILPHAYLLMYT
ncbi:MAG: hypothetical protein QM786_01995 [Breznakibacter sp.]